MHDLEKKTWEILGRVVFPGTSRSIVSFGFVKEVTYRNEKVYIEVEIVSSNYKAAQEVKNSIENTLQKSGIDFDLHFVVRLPKPDARAYSRKTILPSNIKCAIAVASGKGGVGKSTVAVNLAIALADKGKRIGLLDADLYGPSIPAMMGIVSPPKVENNKMIPHKKFQVKTISIGMIVDENTPVIWRGPMVAKALDQLVLDVEWGELDLLIVDMPPGTGDVQISMSQRIGLAGVVIVTTPQRVALLDVRKSIAMFEKVNVSILGIVENMSYFKCPDCGSSTYLFSQNGGAKLANDLGIPLLAQLPFYNSLSMFMDEGVPIGNDEYRKILAESFSPLAEKVLNELTCNYESVDSTCS